MRGRKEEGRLEEKKQKDSNKRGEKKEDKKEGLRWKKKREIRR